MENGHFLKLKQRFMQYITTFYLKSKLLTIHLYINSITNLNGTVTMQSQNFILIFFCNFFK